MLPQYVKIVTLGCPKNNVDSRQMMGYFYRQGYQLTEDPAQAKMILVNTCGFIEAAKRESIETILELAQWKENGDCEYLIVTGCLVQKYAGELKNEIPEIDLLIGTGDIPRLPEMLQALQPGKRLSCVGDPDGYLYDEGLPQVPETIKHYAYVKIAEGCDNRCTYCVIPSIRGRYRSRTMEAIISEVMELARQGVKEVILVAQDTTYYGFDLYGCFKLPELLTKLAKIPQVVWIRLLYTYPNYITDELLQTMQREEKVCSYLDMPLQHISDRILKAMGRQPGQEETIALLTKIRMRYPDFTLRSTFIIGFPGEKEADFGKLLKFLQEFKFERAGFFTYSKEPGTVSAALPGQVSVREKIRRLEIASKLQEGVLAAQQAKWVNRNVQIMVDGPSTDYEGLWEGRTRGDTPEIDGVVYFRPRQSLKAGDVAGVRVTHSQEFVLMGEINHEFAK